jgi:hypothetical protein
LKKACDAVAISLYPGAAGPVKGWWVPKVMLVAVTPGAVEPPFPPLVPAPLLELLPAALLLLLLFDEPQLASNTAITTVSASQATRERLGCRM